MSIVFHPSHTRPRDFENWWWNLLTVNSIYMHDALWSKTTKNADVSTGPLACPFARSLAPLTRGKGKWKMAILSVFFSIFDHSVMTFFIDRGTKHEMSRVMWMAKLGVGWQWSGRRWQKRNIIKTRPRIISEHISSPPPKRKKNQGISRQGDWGEKKDPACFGCSSFRWGDFLAEKSPFSLNFQGFRRQKVLNFEASI